MYCFLIIQCVNVSQTVFISLNLRLTSQHLFNIFVSWDSIQLLVFDTDKSDEEGRGKPQSIFKIIAIVLPDKK